MTAEQERDAIVVWLRGEAAFHRKASFDELKSNLSRHDHSRTETVLLGHCLSIERGDHHKGKDHE